jgi:hypothetical protein
MEFALPSGKEPADFEPRERGQRLNQREMIVMTGRTQSLRSTAGDCTKHRDKQSAFWGGLWGLLFGSEFFRVSGIGFVLVGGPIVALIRRSAN